MNGNNQAAPRNRFFNAYKDKYRENPNMIPPHAAAMSLFSLEALTPNDVSKPIRILLECVILLALIRIEQALMREVAEEYANADEVVKPAPGS